VSVRALATGMPEGWCLERLGILCTKIGSGLTPRGGQSAYVDEGIPLIRSQNVLVGRMDLSDVVFITHEQHAAMSGTYVEPGDVLLNITGASIGRSCTVPMDVPEANVNQHVCIIRPNRRHLLSGYLGHFLNSDQGQQRIWSYQAGGNRQGLNFGQISAFRIPLPPLPEQRRIAEILGTWDEAIALVERRIDAARPRKQGLMQRPLTGRVRFPGFQGAWKEVRLGEVAEINREQVSESNNPGEQYRYIELSAVNQGTIDMPTEPIPFGELPSRARRMLHRGDIIMSTVRPNLLGFGFCDFEADHILCSTGFALLTPRTPSDLDYLYQLLYSDGIMRQIHGRVTGSNYPALNASDVVSLKLPWPENGRERASIGRILRHCDDELDLLTRKLAALQRQKKGLMQRLLTGRVRV